MGNWERVSEAAAARAWGARHYRWYAARRYGHIAIAWLLGFLVVTAVAVVAWHGMRSEWAPVYALGAACVLIAVFFARLAWLISPRAGVVRGSGGLVPMIIGAAFLLLVAVVI